MDEYTADAFLNQDEDSAVKDGASVPQDEPPPTPSKKSKLSGSRLKEKIMSTKDEDPESRGGGAGLSLQGRLLTTLLQQVIPADGEGSRNDSLPGKSSMASMERPPFSLPTMTNNFRRFNARVGILFKFQNRMIKLLSWTHRTQTWSFIFVYSFICLDPYLLTVLPFAVLLLFIMVPAFLARHPPPPPSTSTSSTTPYYSYEGPALAPAKTIKPAPETSKDFFQNMRDLQNSMADISVLHDAAVSTISPLTNFSDETLSSSIFLLFTATAATLFLAAHLLPWRLIFLVGGDAFFLSQHPNAGPLAKLLRETIEVENKTGDKSQSEPDESKDFVLFGISIPTTPSRLLSLMNTTTEICLGAHSEEREVEMFELQHKTHYSPYSTASEWEPFLFTATPYDPLSPSRISADRPRGTRFFEDVRPPAGWVWKSKKWELDLDCREWVMERMVTGVEFEVPDGTDGGMSEEVGGWVWDLPFHPPDEGVQDFPDYLPYDGSSQSRLQQGGDKQGKGVEPPEWEEATKRVDRTGEWRRRRWVRVVQRITMDDKGSRDG